MRQLAYIWFNIHKVLSHIVEQDCWENNYNKEAYDLHLVRGKRMELEEVMYKRRSSREFLTKEIADEDIDTLMHYAMSGPSACNKRTWEFYIIKNAGIRGELRKVTKYTDHVSPLIIIVAGNTKRALALQLNDFWIQDCSAAIENILLGATSLGIGSCWCGLKPQVRPVKKVQTILGIEKHIVPLGLIHLGYTAQEPEQRSQYDKKRIHIME